MTSGDVTPANGEAPIVAATYREARLLADGVSVVQDLRYVLDLLSRLEQEMAQPVPDDLIVRALWSGALVAYVRCFSGRVRVGGTPFLSRSDAVTAGEGAGEFHDWIVNLRNKHVAHSVNPFEQVKVGLTLAPIGEPPSVLGVAALGATLIVTSPEGVSDLRRLVVHLHNAAAVRCRTLEATTLAVGQAMQAEKLYRRPRLTLTAPGPEQASQPRVADDDESEAAPTFSVPQ